MRTTERRCRLCAILILLVCLLAPADLMAHWPQTDKINSADGSAYDYFGLAVSVSGDYAIIGARYDDDNGAQSGSAYIFKRGPGDTWTEDDKLTASDAYANQKFGYSVAISGDFAIVGALGDGSVPGAAYVFRKGGGGWAQVARLAASDGVASDEFGISVSIGSGPISSADYAVVGAYWDDDAGRDSGSVYIFEAPGGAWTDRTEIWKLTSPDSVYDDYFGYAVAVDANVCIVGAQLNNANGLVDSGAGYAFELGETGWEYVDKLTASDAQAGDWLGYSVAMDGDTVVVGAVGNDDNGGQTGSAYVFEREGNTWNEQAKLVASDGAANDWFGSSVGVSGAYVVVGAPSNDEPVVDGGSAYIYARRQGAWVEAAKLSASDAASMDGFGMAVGIDGGWAIVGAYMEDFGADAVGSAYSFKMTCPAADLTDDCAVGYADLGVFADWWLESGCEPGECPGDFDESGTVDFADLAELAGDWLGFN